jgi:DeoR family glycerol-3-phosphate regulon repressor
MIELSERQVAVLSALRRDGTQSVEALARAMQVTGQTMRRDLDVLRRRGLIQRVHGGAALAEGAGALSHEERSHIASDAKAAIGRLAAEAIPNGCSVCLNVGTTTEQVAHALRGHTNLMVLTNNVNIVGILAGTPSKELILAGGHYRQSDGAIVGEAAVEFVSNYKVDVAVIGCSALDEDGAVLDFDPREVSVARAILRNARRKMLVADASKFDRTASARICDIGEIDLFLTDRPPRPRFAAVAEARGTEVRWPGRPG